MTIKVKTIWKQGFRWIGVPEKYIIKTLEDKEDARFVSGKEEMIIPRKEIKKKIKGYSEYFEDQFGRKPYRLAYFNWKPLTEDEKLKKFSEECLS